MSHRPAFRIKRSSLDDGTIGLHYHDEGFQLGLERALASCRDQSADIAEVLETARRITDGDPDSWLDEWMATAGSVWSAAIGAEHAGRRYEALALYHRAATYYAVALRRIFHSSEPERQLDIWRRQRGCWERVVDLSPVPGQRLAIPYENTTLPGFFFPAPDAEPGEPRPLVVLNNGLAVPTSHTWAHGGEAAGAHGYHWMTFDGPGSRRHCTSKESAAARIGRPCSPPCSTRCSSAQTSTPTAWQSSVSARADTSSLERCASSPDSQPRSSILGSSTSPAPGPTRSRP